MSDRADRRKILAWALYDFGNSAFATTVMAGFFPVFFRVHWSAGSTPEESLARVGWTNGVAGLLVALLAPLLGAFGDRAGMRKRLLVALAAAGALATAGLGLTGEGDWLTAAALYVVASLGFSLSIVFSDALLREVSPPGRVDSVSALGYAAGYLGGGLLFALNVAMVARPAWFGLDDEIAAVCASFVTVAAWWAVFTVPLVLRVPEPAPAAGGRAPFVRAAAEAIRQLARTLREARQRPALFLFLLAYWLYIDGVDTMIRMATGYGESLGLRRGDLLGALLLVQFVGFPAALAFGWLGERIGARRGILIGLTVYAAVALWGWRLAAEWEFWVLAALIGLVQGGVQALSRSFYQRLVPRGREGEFFGLYNLLGKFSAVLGPVLMAAAANLTGDVRHAILPVFGLIVAGGVLLTRVKE